MTSEDLSTWKAEGLNVGDPKTISLEINSEFHSRKYSTDLKLTIGRKILKENGFNDPKKIPEDFCWIFKCIEWFKFDSKRFKKRYDSKKGFRSAHKKESLFDLLKFIQKNYGTIPGFKNEFLRSITLNYKVWKAVNRMQKEFFDTD